jgi:hypothetical protein
MTFNDMLFHPLTGAPAVGFRKDGRPIWPILGADGTATAAAPQPSPMLQRLYDERQSAIDFVDQTVAGANVEGQHRDLSQSEQESLTRTQERITAIDKQIVPLEAFEKKRSAGDQAGHQYRSTAQPQATAPAGTPGQALAQRYGNLGAQTDRRAHEYKSRGEVIVDQIRAAGMGSGGLSDLDARSRLLSAGCVYPGATEDEIRTTQVTGDTPGILPVPVIGEVMNDVDGARPFITSVGAKPLSFAGETFKRPVVTQHVAVGKQTTQAASTGLGTLKMVIGSVTFTKETWGGWLDVSRQDIDWTSPAAWDAILNDLTDQYGLATENAAADAFNTAVAAGNTPVEVAGTGSASTLKDYITALYAAAALAYAGAGRLPDTIWMSLDMWGALGPLLESQVATNADPGTTDVGSFAGNLLRLPRFVVPSFAAGTIIIGAKRWTEVYEERIGLLQAVLPSVLGVQLAYGGYVAYASIKATAFCKVVNAA